MERTGGLCLARYAAEPDVAWRVGRIMLRYRPIAPKPVAGGAAATPLPTPADNVSKRKRKGSGCKGEGRRGRKSRKAMADTTTAAAAADDMKKKPDSSLSPFSPPLSSSSSPSCSSNSSMSSPPPTITSPAVVTLPLMPETPERREKNKSTAAVRQQPFPPQLDLSLPCLQQFWRTTEPERRPTVVVAPRPMRPAGSWVTLECVEETWRDGELPLAGDEEIWKSMEAEDACPGFISDRYDRVVVVNEAYKKMAVGALQENVNGGADEVRVALVTRGMVPVGARAFTCRVRVRYASRRGRGTLAAPCDVWRLEDGRLAWRLDTKAALSLSVGQ